MIKPVTGNTIKPFKVQGAEYQSLSTLTPVISPCLILGSYHAVTNPTLRSIKALLISDVGFSYRIGDAFLEPSLRAGGECRVIVGQGTNSGIDGVCQAKSC